MRIEFKNDSVIKDLDGNNMDTVRGKRSKIKTWHYDDFERCCTKEMIEEVLEPFINKPDRKE